MKYAAASLLFVALIAGVMTFGIWRFSARMHDCRSLGHGTVYCVMVWGGR